MTPSGTSNELEIKFSNNSLAKHTKLSLNPNFVTGLVEAEGSFSITKHKDKRAKHGINIGLRFKLSMLSNEIQLLTMVKSFFNCGKISIDKNDVVNFEIKDIDTINKYLLPHFCNYPLRGTKYLDYLSFKKTLDLINSKEHLTKKGIDENIEISNSMNSYREFPENYLPDHTMEINYNYIPISGDYINGFIAGDGCLAFNTKDKNFGRMSLQISQHKYNKFLLISIGKYFKSASKIYYHDVNSLQLTLSGAKLWDTLIFDHFNNYALHGTKAIRLNKFYLIRELMLNKNHLMKVGRFRKWKPEVKLQIIKIWED